jgi:HEAT repeats
MLPRLKRILLGVAIGAAVFAAAIWILIVALGEHQTRYAGRPLNYWLDGVNSRDASVSNQVRQALATEIIPKLTWAMFNDTNDSRLRLALIEQLNNLPGVNIYFATADGRRVFAAQELGAFGISARAAIPELVQAVKGKDSIIRPAATRALGQVHGEPELIIPMLIASLDDPQDDMAEAAADALGGFGPSAKAAVPKLIPLLKAPDKDLRHAATQALKQIAPDEAAKGSSK